MATKTWVGGNGGGTEDYSIAANWSPSGVPGASDDVVVPPTAAYGITAGLNQSAVSLASFTVERGFTKPIGTSSAYLQITTGKFSYEGSAQSWIDLSASAVSPNVLGTASVSTAGQHVAS